MLMYRIGPAVVIAGIAAALVGIVSLAGGNRELARASYWVELTMAAAALIVGIAHRLRRSRHHPRVGRGGHILVRGVDRRTADEWVALNPPGDIEVR
jgi:hypothetical protein